MNYLFYKYEVTTSKELTISLSNCNCAINFPINAFSHSSTLLIYSDLHRMVKPIIFSQIIKSCL